MPNTPVHARLRIGGQLYGDANWSIGVAFCTVGGNDPFANLTTDVQAELLVFANNVKALNTGNILPPSLRALLSTGGSINTIRTSRVGEDGRETEVALIELSPVVKGGSLDPTHSAQNALTLSLMTGRPGASYRGRLYLPALAVSLTSGRLAPANAATIASEAAGWLNDLGNATGNFGGTADCKPCVVSTQRGQRTPITTVRVGNRLDTQRRRAEREKEVYSVASVPQ